MSELVNKSQPETPVKISRKSPEEFFPKNKKKALRLDGIQKSIDATYSLDEQMRSDYANRIEYHQMPEIKKSSQRGKHSEIGGIELQSDYNLS